MLPCLELLTGKLYLLFRYSCSPNSQIEKWFLNGEMSIGIFAAQDIPAGAEISYDYNFSSFSGAQKQKCRCGAPNCRGYIGERLSKNKEAAAQASTKMISGRSGSKANAKKRKTGRRGVSFYTPSIFLSYSSIVSLLCETNFDLFPRSISGERTGVVFAANGTDAERGLDSTAPVRQVQGGQNGCDPIHASLFVP
jgi:hypothetical protein